MVGEVIQSARLHHYLYIQQYLPFLISSLVKGKLLIRTLTILGKKWVKVSPSSDPAPRRNQPTNIAIIIVIDDFNGFDYLDENS